MANILPDTDQLYRSMTIVWLVLLFSQVALFGFAYSFAGPEMAANAADGLLGKNPPIIIGAVFLAFTNLALSFFMRRRSLEQAVAEQNFKHLQTGLIVACALCESISLIGMVLAFAFAYPYFYLWFALGILGIFLHFPRRKHLLDATAKKIVA